MKQRRKKLRVIPGFGLSLGITVAILSFIVIIPLCSLVVFSAHLSPTEFIQTVTSPRVLASYKVSFLTALTASLINAVMGLIVAWVLVRYEFPGKRILDGMIEVPFALPTAVAGIALTHMTVDTSVIGGFFHHTFGIDIAYTRTGITLALVFIGIPFVVRSVQPVLEKLDGYSYDKFEKTWSYQASYVKEYDGAYVIIGLMADGDTEAVQTVQLLVVAAMEDGASIGNITEIIILADSARITVGLQALPGRSGRLLTKADAEVLSVIGKAQELAFKIYFDDGSSEIIEPAADEISDFVRVAEVIYEKDLLDYAIYSHISEKTLNRHIEDCPITVEK